MTNSFSISDAQVYATLAAVAYAGDTLNDADPSLETLRTAINHQLDDKPTYATGSDWSLVWGPIETDWTDNLMYVAVNKDTGTMAVVLRGTTTQALSRFEDVPRSFRHFPDPNGTARVSGPFLDGVERMLAARDTWQGSTFGEFYKAHAADLNVKDVVVTGHSQGASLVPIMMLALKHGLNGAPQLAPSIRLRGFAIAPPTSGDPEFAGIVNAQCNCWFVINPKDILPLGYNAMYSAITDGIPIELNEAEKILFEVLIDGLNLLIEPSAWAQPSQRAILESSVTDAGLLDQIGQQHNHNSYLTKLGVASIDVGDPSPFAVCLDPKITFPNGTAD